MSDHSNDERFLRQALELARKGIGLASPNPHVGAVIVDADGIVAGTGFHTYQGVKHAEVLAMEAAGAESRGGTLYINLEPCSHQGRTPPCADAVIAAGIRRVVASMSDPNPKVSGRGFEKLRAAGVQVEIGGLEEDARRLNEAFAHYIRSGRPLVTLKSAMTLNGKIAPPPGFGTEKWITGELSRARVQQLRHQHDALVTGIGTVLADDPRLTDRAGLPRRRPLLRVILDSHLRLPLTSRLVREVNPAANDVLVFYSAAEGARKTQLEDRGVRVEQISAATDGRPDLQAVLQRLGELENTSAMIEAGAALNSAGLRSQVVDKLFFFYAPTVLPEAGSVPFTTAGNATEKSAPVGPVRLHQFGADFAIETYLRDPYRS